LAERATTGQLLRDLLRCLPQRHPGNRPELLARAAGPGRIRGTAIEAWGAACSDPTRSGPILARHLRAARHLHSWERRLVAAGLYALVRHHALLAAVLATAEPLPLWLGWLVVQGLPVEQAGEHHDAPFARIEHLGEVAAELLESSDPAQAVALAGSFDPRFAELLLGTLGNRAASFLAASNVRAPLVLRVNRGRTDRARVLDHLGRLGVTGHPSPLAPDGVVVDQRFDAHASPLYRRGQIEVQDEGSQILTELVAVEPGMRVVDACAGAGGKTLAMAAQMGGKGKILAYDVRKGALAQLRKRAARAGVADLIETRVVDATAPLPPMRAERVLVDAPCTGTGTLRRQPELRWRLRPDWVDACSHLQLDLLSRASALVAPGGWLVYLTCSVLRQEDEQVVDAFLAAHPGFCTLPASEVLGSARARELGANRCLRVAPHTHGTDGFYGAVLQRRD